MTLFPVEPREIELRGYQADAIERLREGIAKARGGRCWSRRPAPAKPRWQSS
jgi:hypothetical protein